MHNEKKYVKKFRKKMKKTSILVFRTFDNEIKNSKPCKNCIETMQKWCVGKVYYSTKNGLVGEKVSDITNNHETIGDREIKRRKIT
jgi:hypothetical protein